MCTKWRMTKEKWLCWMYSYLQYLTVSRYQFHRQEPYFIFMSCSSTYVHLLGDIIWCNNNNKWERIVKKVDSSMQQYFQIINICTLYKKEDSSWKGKCSEIVSNFEYLWVKNKLQSISSLSSVLVGRHIKSSKAKYIVQTHTTSFFHSYLSTFNRGLLIKFAYVPEHRICLFCANQRWWHMLAVFY